MGVKNLQDTKTLTTVLQNRSVRMLHRRNFIRRSTGLGVGLLGGPSLSSCGSRNDDNDMTAGEGPTDVDNLTFALNLE